MATLLTETRPARTPAGQASPAAPPAPADRPARLVSLDAYRGFIMLAMASGGLYLSRVVQQLDLATLASSTLGLAGSPAQGPLSAVSALVPDRADLLPANRLLSFLGFQADHVAWVGCSFWDLIQPSFLFMVGVALPYSFASRRSRGDSYLKMLGHAISRALILVLLAVFLSSPARDWSPEGARTNFEFPNVLAQIGLGYVFVFLLVGRGPRVQLAALAAILAGYTLLFGLYPLPGPGFNYEGVGVKPGWHHLNGWFAHWDKNTNAAAAFDVWFLNLFPRGVPFRFNEGGYQTLNFVPSMGTMILGLMAGEMLRGRMSPRAKLLTLAWAGAACLALGWLAGQTVVPIVKRIWTPSWVLFSAGWTFWMLAAFYAVIDLKGYRRWSLPLVVVGMNSIAMYCMAQLMKGWVGERLRIHLGPHWFTGPHGIVVQSAAVLVVLWLICVWLYRRGIFLRV